MVSTIQQITASRARSIIELFKAVRSRTMQIVAPLEIEDYVIQTAEFMSPSRWHIGHTSWFFETVLRAHQPGYKVYSEDYLFYFNSYYEGFGARIERPKRGTKSRPTVKETVAYRNHVDEQMVRLLHAIDDHPDAEIVLGLVRLGLEHEMQHQELLVYDIKHLLCDQFDAPMKAAPPSSVKVEGMAEIEGGLFWLGYDIRGGSPTRGPQAGSRAGVRAVREGSYRTPSSERVESGDKSPHSKNYDFAFDNEKPAHQVFLQDFAIDRALVNNGDFLEFIRDGGYQDFRWWFSEGWETVAREHWQAPLYWKLHDGEWMIRDFSGLHPATSKTGEPVSHVSYYEASAFAKWAGKRLPTEAEWEKAACFAANEGARRSFPWGNESVDSLKAN